MSRWITEWNPEDGTFWRGQGRRVALRNMITSIACEHIGFSVWSLWSVLVLFLGPTYHVDAAGKFMLTAIPTFVGSVLRLPYSYAVVRFGGRNWTIISALLLLVPTISASLLIHPGVSYTTLVVLAAVAGVGGGNFASSMTNINAYYPRRLKGWALGLNAGGGNIGVAVVQLVGLLVLATAGKDHPAVLTGVYIPLIVLAATAAALFMDNLTVQRDKGAMAAATKLPQTWVISLLYIGTFGSFIGFGFAFGQVLQVQFAHQYSTPLKAAYITFIGPLIGSLVRPIGGKLADRFGGGVVSFATFVLMAGGTAVVLAASSAKSLGLFVAGFVLLFAFSGIGNGSVYKLIPVAFQDRPDAERITGAVIGIAGAIGALGGVLVNIAFRESFLTTKNGNAAYIAFIAYYVLCFAVTWAVYLRKARVSAAEPAVEQAVEPAAEAA
ncbi:nitrate/nitrite transporter [Actinospica sp.]|jgi:NNP family nitrate/nitrite transporter-like MFS transporter|uniref:nitrate/nitrite transporter n=1 Tax=Actinospica sp. TaxID=1872142 RepID=UPI002B822374|nr:nitrate/nitrite transporter [Actinospica sp.]HWG28890.1 nitrate/nitrite transporter [Actinospica sp.]